MKIYIAASWKHQHAVEMLTERLRRVGHEVVSFVEEAVETENYKDLKFDLDTWIASEDGEKKFWYDINGAMKSQLVIYIGPSGTDAWAEIGAAFASGTTILGLHAKGEPSGLMRRMITWYHSVDDILDAVRCLQAATEGFSS